MIRKRDAVRGALLGLAVGDAMGNTVDSRNLEEIRRDYGPNGLLGYDLANGYADITSYTQLAAFCANGLLLGLTRGKKAPLENYVAVALGSGPEVSITANRSGITAGFPVNP